MVTRSEAHLRDLASRSARRYRMIIGVGGDTTFNIIASAILNAFPSGTPADAAPLLGMIGTGSANDILRGLGIHSIPAACRAIIVGACRDMDIGCVYINGSPTPVYFLGALSLGLGATVNQYVETFFQRFPRLALLNPFSQIFAGFWAVSASFKRGLIPVPVQIQIPENKPPDAHTIHSCSLAVILNSPFYAGGLRLSPYAADNDNRLDCCILSSTGFFHTLKLALPIFLGRQPQHPAWTFLQNPCFSLSRADLLPFDIQADGEIITGVRTIGISTVSPGLKVFYNAQ